MEGLDKVSAGAAIGSFFAVLLLFAPPVTLLGMVAPFAGAPRDRRRALTRARSPAACTRSRPSASLLGTFSLRLVLIPAIGTRRTC